MKIGIIDYSSGNLKSVRNALNYVGATDVDIVDKPEKLAICDKIVLPGVGAFRKAMQILNERGFIDALEEEVIVKKKYFFGICLGMQLIMDKSYEHGETEGFKWVRGDVQPFSGKTEFSVPHMGWNDTKINKYDPILEGVENGTDFYYLHSYFVNCKNQEDVLATCNYGFDFAAIIKIDNIYAVQFHPEKSQNFGLKIINNFVKA